jgi:hypothetical protein
VRRQNLTEAGAHTEILERNSDGSMLIQVITPGWGSSGYYATEVLEAAGKAKVWPKGTHMYFDHPSASEAADRPERSVKDLAATLTEDARWDSGRKALIARAEPVGLGKAVFADEAFRKAVACSVRASAEMEIGEAEGRSGWIVEKIHAGTQNSVDFVTHAGRGGMILESARAALDNDIPAAFLRESAVAKIREARNIGQWIESRLHLELTQLADNMFGDGRLTRPERIALSSAVGDALQAFVADLEKSAPQLYTRDLWADPAALAMAAEAVRPARETAAADTEQAIQDAVGQAYSDADKETYSWLRDYDPDQKLAYFELRPGQPGRANPHKPGRVQESEEDTMPQHRGERDCALRRGRRPGDRRSSPSVTPQSGARRGRAPAGRVQRRDLRRPPSARTRVTEANATLPAAVVDRIVEAATRTVPLTEAGNPRRDGVRHRRRRRPHRRGDLPRHVIGRGRRRRRVSASVPVKEGEVTREDSNKAIAEAFGRQPQDQPRRADHGEEQGLRRGRAALPGLHRPGHPRSRATRSSSARSPASRTPTSAPTAPPRSTPRACSACRSRASTARATPRRGRRHHVLRRRRHPEAVEEGDRRPLRLRPRRPSPPARPPPSASSSATEGRRGPHA